MALKMVGPFIGTVSVLNGDNFMPLISLSISHQISEEELESISRSLTRVTELVLNKDPSVTRVDIGYSASFLNSCRSSGFSYSLNVSITAGSNSGDECARWLNEAHNVMEKYCSADSVNYITVNEISGNLWGYNGISQQSRKKEV